MAIKSKLSLVIATGALALAATAVSSAAADLPPVTIVSMQVKPLIAVASPGKMLFLDLFCEGVSGVGTQTPVSITGAPDGTRMEVKAVSEQQALLGLVFRVFRKSCG